MERILIYLEKYKGRVLGVGLGGFLGLMILRYGWLSTFFWIICLSLGYIIGRRLDENESWQDIIERFWPKR